MVPSGEMANPGKTSEFSDSSPLMSTGELESSAGAAPSSNLPAVEGSSARKTIVSLSGVKENSVNPLEYHERPGQSRALAISRKLSTCKTSAV